MICDFLDTSGLCPEELIQILNELEQKKIYIVDEKKINPDQEEFIENYFLQIIRPKLVPVMLDKGSTVPQLKGGSLYLAIRLLKNNGRKVKHAIIEVPTGTLPRPTQSNSLGMQS